MKLVWCPETASKAYIDTVKSCNNMKESSVAELVSAMAAGWNARVVVETWSRGGEVATSIGLAVATHHTGGRHICIVPDQESRSEYVAALTKSGHEAADVIVGRPEEAMEGLHEGVDLAVVDCPGLFRAARLAHRGAVLICKNATWRAAPDDFRWRSVVDANSRVLKSVFMPVGNGLDIAYIGGAGSGARTSRWIKHVDRRSGEEFVFRK